MAEVECCWVLGVGGRDGIGVGGLCILGDVDRMEGVRLRRGVVREGD